jgi:hypothetical protein
VISGVHPHAPWPRTSCRVRSKPGLP